jgi:hypothetical protein
LPRPGFESTTVYFEWLAQKGMRDDDQRQRLPKVAGFYRSLQRCFPPIACCGALQDQVGHRPQSSSSSRFTAGAAGFFDSLHVISPETRTPLGV